MKQDPIWLAKRAAYLTMGITNTDLDELVDVVERSNTTWQDSAEIKRSVAIDLFRLLVRVSERLGTVYAASLMTDYSRFASMSTPLVVAREIAQGEINFPEAAALLEHFKETLRPERNRG